MPAFVHDQAYRALEVVDRIPAGCIGVIVTREDFDPHLRHAEVRDRRFDGHGSPRRRAVRDRGPISTGTARATASLAIVQAYHREGRALVPLRPQGAQLGTAVRRTLHRRGLAAEVRRQDHRRDAADVAG